jgi:hypothetical protein
MLILLKARFLAPHRNDKKRNCDTVLYAGRCCRASAPGFSARLRCQAVGSHGPFKEAFGLIGDQSLQLRNEEKQRIK